MASALGVIITNNVTVSGAHAQPVYVDNTLPIGGGPAQAVIIAGGDIPQLGGPAIPVRYAPLGSPTVGPAMPIYVVSGYLPSAYGALVQSLGPIAYWPMDEQSGTVSVDQSGNGRNGAYTAVTLGQPGMGDGRTAASFDGTASINNVFSTSMQSAFGSAEGTIALWAKVANVGVWSDATVRRFATFQVDANNRVYIEKVAGANTFGYNYVAGGTAKNRNRTTSTTEWFHACLTWSKSNDQVIAYFNGVQEGATLTGLGVWAGSIVSTNTNIGANATTPTSVWSGLLAHAAVWNTPLSAAQVLTLAQVP